MLLQGVGVSALPKAALLYQSDKATTTLERVGLPRNGRSCQRNSGQ